MHNAAVLLLLVSATVLVALNVTCRRVLARRHRFPPPIANRYQREGWRP